MPDLPPDRPVPRSDGLEVRPFRALTYRRHDPDHLARVTSPAYDLVTAAGRERLARTDPENIVRLILPGVEADDTALEDPAARDRRSAATAASTLRRWLDDRVLVRDPEPALWGYELAPPAGPASTGWLASLTLPRPGSVAVLPHEDTYAPAVAGRRALLAATATDLEPIVLAHDPDAAIAALTRSALTARPTLEVADPDGVRHRLWRVTDPSVLERLVTAFRSTSAVIADGHHRFAAAQAHQQAGGAHAEAILALLTPIGAGGLRLQAIHRVVPDLTLASALTTAATGFAVRGVETPPGDLVRALHARIGDPGPATFLLTDGQQAAELTDPAPALRAAVPAGAPAWRTLDVVLAHHGLIRGLWGRADDPAAVLIAHDVTEAVDLARERAGVAVLLRSPSSAAVAAVARAGARMPRKSTLFVPKPRTGLVLRPHAG